MSPIIRFWKKSTPRKKIQLGLVLLIAGLAICLGLRKIGIFADVPPISNTSVLTYTDANGDLQTVQSNTVITTVTVSPSPSSGTITLKIALQGRTNQNASGITLNVYSAGTSNLAFQNTNLSTDPNGNVSVDATGLLIGTKYDFLFKVPIFLSQKLSGAMFTSPLSLDFGIAKSGDLNNDNIVNSLDFSSLNGNWLKNAPSADINGDGIVNSIDFSLMNGNWLVTGQ